MVLDCISTKGESDQNMKVGIISINAHTKVLNFASPLHSYAFQQYLFQHGIDNVIIDYKPVYYNNFDPRHPLFYFVDHPKKKESAQKAELKKWRNLFFERESRYDKVDAFLKKYYHTTDVCYDPWLIDEKDPGYDCYICVTDIIWKYNPNTGFDKGFFLAGKTMEGKGKIAYSASRGAKGYTKQQEEQFLELTKDFDFISVREKSLKEYMESICDKPVTQVIDPVFLQEKEFYFNLANKPKKKGYVLLYVVMDKSHDLVETAVRFAVEHDLDVIELSEDMEDAHIPEGTSHPVLYDLGVEDWLGYMENASYIFTNSFHGCCLSIIMQKQFFAGPRVGDKIDNLLEMFNLQNRRVNMGKDDSETLKQSIDYEPVEALRKKYIQESEEFLLGAIKQIEQKMKK